MDLSRLQIFILLIASVLPLVAVRGTAQARLDSRLSHRWTYVGDTQEATRLGAAIDAATEDMSRVIRGIARRRLRSRTEPATTLVIQLDDRHVSIRRDEFMMRLPMDGTPTTVTQNPSHPTIRASLEGGHLILDGRTAQGRRRALYEVLQNGLLRLSVRIQANRLPAPVVYQLTYRRAAR